MQHWAIRLVYAGIGAILLFVNYKRNVRRIEWEERREKEKEGEEKEQKMQRLDQVYNHFIRQGLF
jgi:hypothetical protein